MILADIDSIPATFLKYALIFGGSLIGLIGGILFIVGHFKKQSVTVDPQPLEVSKQPKRFNREFEDARHVEIDRRLETIEKDKDALWNTMRDEDKAIRAEMTAAVKDVHASISQMSADTERSLGRIEGKLDRR